MPDQDPIASIIPSDSLRIGRVAAPLREQVASVLRDAILDFRLKPGQRLIERELIEQTGVSRTTIREVLRQLATEGLVTTIPQKGAVVVVPSPAEAADLYEVRQVLEALVVRRFVERASAAQREALREATDEYERVVRSGADTREQLRAKDRFYDTLTVGAANAAVTEILSSLQARVRVLRASSMSQPGRAVEAVEEIKAIVERIEAGDADGAAQKCVEHLQHAADTGLRALAGADVDVSDAPAGWPAPS
jgi:DNA-binding GntR family transcriptional regulator